MNWISALRGRPGRLWVLAVVSSLLLWSCGDSELKPTGQSDAGQSEDAGETDPLPDGIHLRPDVDYAIFPEGETDGIVVDDGALVATFSGPAADEVGHLEPGDFVIVGERIWAVASNRQVGADIELGLGQFNLLEVIYGNWDHEYSIDELFGDEDGEPLRLGESETREQDLGALWDKMGCKSLTEIKAGFGEEIRKSLTTQGINAVVDELFFNFRFAGGFDANPTFRFTGKLPLGIESDHQNCRSRYGKKYCIEDFVAVANFTFDTGIKFNLELPGQNGFTISPDLGKICEKTSRPIPLGQSGFAIALSYGVGMGAKFEVDLNQAYGPATHHVEAGVRTKLPLGFFHHRDDRTGIAPNGLQRTHNGQPDPYSIQLEPIEEDEEKTAEDGPLSVQVEFFLKPFVGTVLTTSVSDRVKLNGPEFGVAMGPFFAWEPGNEGNSREEACARVGGFIEPELTAKLEAEVDAGFWDYKKDLFEPVSVWSTRGELLLWWDEFRRLCLRTKEGEVCDEARYPCESGTGCACNGSVEPGSECTAGSTCQSAQPWEPIQVHIHLPDDGTANVAGSPSPPLGANLTSVSVEKRQDDGSYETMYPTKLFIDGEEQSDRVHVLSEKYPDYECSYPLTESCTASDTDQDCLYYWGQWDNIAVTFQEDMIVEFPDRIEPGDMINILKPISRENQCIGTGAEFLVGLHGQSVGGVGQYAWRFSEHANDRSSLAANAEVKECIATHSQPTTGDPCWPY
jgi:hypothetical protein